MSVRRVLVAGGGTVDVYSPATGTWTATGPMVYPYASAAAVRLPNGQVLYIGGRRVKYCGQDACDERLAGREDDPGPLSQSRDIVTPR
jgi:hypothetical protein